MKILHTLFLIVLLLHLSNGWSQSGSDKVSAEEHQLNQIINDPESPDSSKVSALLDVALLYFMQNPDTALTLCHKAEKIAEDNRLVSSYSNVYGWLGYLYREQNKTNKAIAYYHKSLNTSIKLRDKDKAALALIGLGLIYQRTGELTKALDYVDKGLRLREELGDEHGIAAALNNLGGINKMLGNLEIALNHYQRSLQLQQKIGNKSGMETGYNNVATCFSDLNQLDSAIHYLNLSMDIAIESDNLNGIARCHNNLGSIYLQMGDKKKAREHYSKCLEIIESIGYKIGIASVVNNIGKILVDQGKASEAKKYAKKSMRIAKELGEPLAIKRAAELLVLIHEELGEGIPALEMHRLSITMRDSINNIRTQNAADEQRIKHEYETQKILDDAENERKVAAEKRDKERQKIYTYITIIGLIILTVFLIIIFNRLKITRKQKGIIDEQHQQLEETHKEITDSISYAKRIQKAILPPDRMIEELLPNAFIFYKPKDVVAGDFYWLDRFGDKTFFAAADCTGHGVPGAMVSVICNNALNRSVNEFQLTDPAQILDKTREIVLKEFEKSDEEVKDGMDIALCSLKYPINESEKTILHYAGAHNALWIIRKDAEEVEEIKADKQPIGKYADEKPFTTHTVELSKGDTIYTFSDGFQDQFGGEKGKKFKAKNFKQLLVSLQHETMQRQSELIDETFENWRGTLEQLDDVCVIGVRV